MTTKMIGVKDFRQNLAKYVEKARSENQRLIILRKNEPIFELRPLSSEDAVLEKLVVDVNKAQDDLEKGNVYSQEEIKSLFGVA